MERIHLFELEDFAWFPAFLRDCGTDFLRLVSERGQIFDSVLPVLEKGVAAGGGKHVIDLASGGGGGLLRLNARLKRRFPDLEILLTDYHPNTAAFEHMKRQADNIGYLPLSLDARAVPAHLQGLRTMFLSFHHFKPADARLILQNAVDARQPIAVFEAQERSLASFASLLFLPAAVWLATPFIRPFKIGRLVFTYLLPAVPLFVWWDGLVSCLRTYSTKEMEGLVAQVEGGNGYDWEIGRVRTKTGVNLHLLGTPKSAA